MANIVSMINWKGGVGKTTLAYHIGIGLWKFLSKRTLVIDLDPQANLSFLAVGGANKYAQLAYKSGKPSTLLDLYNRYFDGKPLDLNSLIHEKATVRQLAMFGLVLISFFPTKSSFLLTLSSHVRGAQRRIFVKRQGMN